MEKPPGRRRLSLERINTTISSSEIERDRVREDAFRLIILNELSANFTENLADAEFTDDQIREIGDEIATLSFENATKVYCVPYETAARKFHLLHDKVQKGDIEPKDIPGLLIEEAERYGFGIGYHNSPTEIKPDRENRWFIKPTESDHRDNDLARAYFATTFKTLYRKGTPKHMYIVRTLAETTKTDGNWSRSNGMSVITSVPIDRIDGWVNTVLRDAEKKENAAQKNAASQEEQRM